MLVSLPHTHTHTDRYVMEDYDARSTFSSFLPGVAGYFGKPVWAFYVNRGQAIATFGTESKEYPLLEFNSANKAYQMTPFIGFRTFLKTSRGSLTGTTQVIEPFAPDRTRDGNHHDSDTTKPKRILLVGTNEVEIQEIDAANGLATSVQYFILPEEDFAALMRRTTITNTGSTPLELDILDGLAKMEPFGGPLDGMLKSMGRTLEGWMGVYHGTSWELGVRRSIGAADANVTWFVPTGDESLNMPFYKLSTEPSDTAAVKVEEAGHYCLSFIEQSGKKSELLPIVYDTEKVFGMDTTLVNPFGLHDKSVQDILDADQFGWAKTSSSFAAISQLTLAPGENVTISSLYGKALDIKLLPVLATRVTAANFMTSKIARARKMISELTSGVETKTVNPLFDGTVRQMYLDNVLRGGLPTVLGNVEGDDTYDEDPGLKIFHSFSRIHGDLERYV